MKGWLAFRLRRLADRVDPLPVAVRRSELASAAGQSECPALTSAAALPRPEPAGPPAEVVAPADPPGWWLSNRRIEWKLAVTLEELIDRLASTAGAVADATGGDGDSVEDAVAEAGGLEEIRRQRLGVQWELAVPDLVWHLERSPGSGDE